MWSDLDRFWSKVDRSGGFFECWPWLAPSLTAKGYGYFSIGGRMVVASRWILSVSIGRPLASGEYALHSCDNPRCCNPVHIRVGTIAENNAEAARRGRMHERLSADDVRAIRAAVASGLPTSALASRYGVSTSMVRAIARRAKRQHVAEAA